jgi:hypothetical protein
MTRHGVAALVLVAMVCVSAGHGPAVAAEGPGLTGRWTLNKSLSQIPKEVGFGMDIAARAGTGSDAGDRSGGGGGSPAAMVLFRESADDSRRRDLLVEEVRTPSPHLTIAQADTIVTMVFDSGQSRTFHADGRAEALPLDQVSVMATSKWDGTRLDVRYRVEQNRELHYTYSRAADPPQLVVQVRFIERNDRLSATFVYEPAKANEALPAAPAAPTPTPEPPAGRAPGLNPPSAAPAPAAPSAPASPATRPVGAPGPDAELKGLTALGVVVEDLSQQAPACGLSRAPLEAAVTKSLTDAGFKALRNSDEDSYLYVQIMTTATPSGLCVSRYDVYLYSHTNATLPYQSSPALVQIELLHKGGLTGGSAGTHGDAVGRSVRQTVDEFASRIRAVGK